MGNRAGGRRSGPKCIAIVGPFASGKTTLLDALLARTGAIVRQNSVASGNSVGDYSPEARAHAMSVEATIATTEFMGDSITFIDCPGSIEFAFEAQPVLAACDLAVVVAEPDEKKFPALQLIMRQLDDMFQGRVITRYSTQDAVEEEVLKADVVIGAVLSAGAAAPKLVRREHLSRMKPGSVLVDVSIDQGGCFETSRPTTHADPTYTIDGVVHYCVANMPGAAPRTSSEALVHATLPFGLQLADRGLDALKKNPHLAKGLNVLKGDLTHPAVAEALGKPFKDPYKAWG